MREQSQPAVVAIEGIDGSGKSHTAREASVMLTDAYPDQMLCLIDADGVTTYKEGEARQEYQWLERLGHPRTRFKLGQLACIGAFALARRYLESSKRLAADTDLLVAVRDPNRVDPAVYAPVFGPSLLGKISAAKRLRIFDKLSLSDYPDKIINLNVEPKSAAANTQRGMRTRVYNHERVETLQTLAEEMTEVLGRYTELFGRPVEDVDGLCSTTTEEVAGAVEPLLAKQA